MQTLCHEANAFEKCLLHVAGHDRRDPALAVERDVHDEVAAGHAGDLGVLFVDWVAIQDSAVGFGMLEQFRSMPALDRLERGHARADQLSAAGVAGHQMRLDQAGGDFQVGLHIAAVDPSGNPARRRADEGMFLEPGAEVVFDAVSPRRSRARAFRAFPPRCWGGASRSRPGSRCSLAEFRPRAEPAASAGGSCGWDTGRVMSQIKMHASLRPAASVSSGWRPDRLLECPGDGGLGIFERRDLLDRERADNAIRGEFDGQASPPVVEGDFHSVIGLLGSSFRVRMKMFR